MSYVAGVDRGQASLLPASVEDYVDAGSPVRVIEAFVAGLDPPPSISAAVRNVAVVGYSAALGTLAWTTLARDAM